MTGYNPAIPFQFLIHLENADEPTEAFWQTVLDYHGDEDQFIWHRSGTWEFQTTEGYNEDEFQFLWHEEGAWTWETYHDYNGDAHQLVFQNQSDWTLKTTSNYLDNATQLLLNVSDAWQWLTVTSQIVHRIDDVALQLVGDKLRLTITRTPVTVYGVVGTQNTVVREVDTTECTV
jgi:hypothetical protein